jgi:hypothetical protein
VGAKPRTPVVMENQDKTQRVRQNVAQIEKIPIGKATRGCCKKCTQRNQQK